MTGTERLLYSSGVAILMCVILAGAALLDVPRGVLEVIGTLTIISSGASVYVLARAREKRLSEPRRDPKMTVAPPDDTDKDWRRTR